MMKATRLSAVLVVCFALIGCDDEKRGTESEKALLDVAKKVTPSMKVTTASVEGLSLDTTKDIAKTEQKTKTKKDEKKTDKQPAPEKKATEKKDPDKTTSEEKKIAPGDKDIFEVELMETDGLELMELIVAEGVESRKPVNPNVQFELGTFEKLYAFVKVSNPDKMADEISFSWAPLKEDGRERGEISVSIGEQKKWRTWAFTRAIRKVGKWQVIVRNKDGEVIGRAPFEVVEAS